MHVSGQGEGTSASAERKCTSVARIGQLCPNFVHNNDTFWKIVSFFENYHQIIIFQNLKCPFRKPEKIVELAKRFAEQGFRKGKYNLFTRNCQHFASICAVGLEISPEAVPVAVVIRS